MTSTKVLLAFLLLAWPAAAQIHLGLRAGVPLTDITETVNTSTALINLPSRWAVGPMVELDLPFGFGIEANALYRRVGHEVPVGSEPPANGNGEVRQGLWDFPLIAKYKFSGRLARPYFGGGWTYRNLNDLLRFTSSSHGLVFVAGVRINALAIRISPEVRYTRWTNYDVQPGFRTGRNQAEILVGVTF